MDCSAERIAHFRKICEDVLVYLGSLREQFRNALLFSPPTQEDKLAKLATRYFEEGVSLFRSIAAFQPNPELEWIAFAVAAFPPRPKRGGYADRLIGGDPPKLLWDLLNKLSNLFPQLTRCEGLPIEDLPDWFLAASEDIVQVEAEETAVLIKEMWVPFPRKRFKFLTSSLPRNEHHDAEFAVAIRDECVAARAFQKLCPQPSGTQTVVSGMAIDSQLKPVERFTVNERMRRATVSRPESLAWSAREWAVALGCAVSTVHGTEMWYQLERTKQLNRMERVERGSSITVKPARRANKRRRTTEQ